MKTISTFSSQDALGFDDATGLAARLQKKEVSSLELVEAAIARAEVANPQINAIVFKAYDQARAKAIQLDQSRSSNFFAGIPLFVKDNAMVKGQPTTWGSGAFTTQLAPANSPFVDQLFSLDLISLGKSSLPEFGLTGTTEPLIHGPTRNPKDLERSSGGSSGGAAALVASGVVPLAHGNDGGGSIRIPAACCGLIGLKTSRERFVLAPVFKQTPLILVGEGILSRSVRDTYRFIYEAQKFFQNPRLPAIQGIGKFASKKYRIGFFRSPLYGQKLAPEIEACLDQTATRCEKFGHRVEEMKNPYPKTFVEDFMLYWGFLAFLTCRMGKSVFGESFEAQKTEPLTRGLARHFTKNLIRAPLALLRLKRLRAHYDQLMTNYDMILSPTLSQLPPLLGHFSPEEDFALTLQKMRENFPLTPPLNVTGAPAISLPLGESANGLPIGMQFASFYGRDEELLEFSMELLDESLD